jgi:uncharacterized membrane protein (DUF485 family)
MFSKSNLISTIVGAIWLYGGGFLLWDTIGSNLFENPQGGDADQVHLVIACLILAFAVSTIYSKLASGGHSLSHGATYGLWLGILIGFGERWFDIAFGIQASLTDGVINGVLNIVSCIVLGILISMVYGKTSS